MPQGAGFGRAGRKGAVPHDLYGVNPSQVEAYRTWTGFSFSLLVYIIVTVACAYVIWEYLTIPYDLAEASVLYDSEVDVGPESEPAMPDIGITFTLKNKSQLFEPNIIDFQFHQEVIFGDGTCLECRESARVENERCRFLSELRGGNEEEDLYDRSITAVCPMWGEITHELDNNTGVVDHQFVRSPNGTRFNASVPRVQGNFQDEEYAFIRADVWLNLTGLATVGQNQSILMDDIYGGTMLVVVATHPHDLADKRIAQKIPRGYKVWERSLEIKEFYMTKLDVPLSMRTIEQGHFMVDFDVLAKEYVDVVVGNAEIELDDTDYIPSIYKLWNATGTIPNITKGDGTVAPLEVPEAIKLAEIFFHVARDSHRIVMSPPSTLFDLLGIVGGFISLFSLMIGWPAMLINSLQFRHALKLAQKKGDIPEDYLDNDGSVKFDKTNEVVRVLNHVDVEGALLVGGVRQLGKTCSGVGKRPKRKTKKGDNQDGPSEVHPASDTESV